MTMANNISEDVKTLFALYSTLINSDDMNFIKSVLDSGDYLISAEDKKIGIDLKSKLDEVLKIANNMLPKVDSLDNETISRLNLIITTTGDFCEMIDMVS